MVMTIKSSVTISLVLEMGTLGYGHNRGYQSSFASSADKVTHKRQLRNVSLTQKRQIATTIYATSELKRRHTTRRLRERTPKRKARWRTCPMGWLASRGVSMALSSEPRTASKTCPLSYLTVAPSAWYIMNFSPELPCLDISPPSLPYSQHSTILPRSLPPRWSSKSLLYTTPCTAISRLWPSLLRKVSRLPVLRSRSSKCE